MGLFDKLFGKTPAVPAIEVAAEKNTLYLPLEGMVIPLEEIEDAVFSQGVLGQGCGIRPTEEIVYAPVNGTVTTIAGTKHAIGLLSEDGAEVLIHVGMDTVDMNGDGFTVFVQEAQKVAAGTPLLRFSAGKIKAAGHPTTTAFVLTNSDDLSEITVLATGELKKLSPVIKART